MVILTAEDVAAANPDVAAKEAVIECVPAANVVVLIVATPFAGVAVPIEVVPS